MATNIDIREDIVMASLSQLAGMAIDDLENIEIPVDLYKGLQVLIKISDYQLDNPEVLGNCIVWLNLLMAFYTQNKTEHGDVLRKELLSRIRDYEARITRDRSGPQAPQLFAHCRL